MSRTIAEECLKKVYTRNHFKKSKRSIFWALISHLFKFLFWFKKPALNYLKSLQEEIKITTDDNKKNNIKVQLAGHHLQ